MQSLLGIFHSGTVAPETVENLIIPTLESMHRELLAVAVALNNDNCPVDLSDPYLKRHAARYLHPTLGSDSIWRVASYLDMLPPGQNTVPAEIAHRVMEILSLVEPEPSESLG
ncbi:hypothetical protein LQF76_05890 [Gloeomargaritales cyanobacterium VI4D9]|nr:hypothetical protein LQF76_13000 [Gloeomargaritales cyanobacterium VI4D9]WAS06410.1 hypothetical protein LQF76_05890 [Gloeomargaritales cyanobacterium VI4D9]